MAAQNLYNPIVKTLLRSPLHVVMSKSTLLLTFTGRKSGKTYSTPVNYLQDGDTLVIITQAARTWWKNLRGGAPVEVVLRGTPMTATATAYEDGPEQLAGVRFQLENVPAMRRYYDVGEEISPEKLAEIAEGLVAIRISDLQS